MLASAPVTPAIIVHGGAGLVDGERLPRCVSGVAGAAEAGWEILARGGSALDAVQAAVELLEDDPEFNAGHGAVLNREGEIEVDAAIMSGDLRAGAVGCAKFLRHPIRVARKLLEEGVHILLAGEGAIDFAREHGIEQELHTTLITDRARKRWEEERAGRLGPSATGDTVGACAIDAAGMLAVATSTGGISGKRRGRVGDSPIIGAGTYADARGGACSATGHGESLLRVSIGHYVVERLAAGEEAFAAARAAVKMLDERVGPIGQGGVILVDKLGRVGWARNTASMPWASIVDGVRDGGA